MKNQAIGRPRVYSSNAEKQAAYRKRKKHQRVSVHFKSNTDMWSTPPELFAELHAEFNFQLDVCAIAENARCPRFFSPTQNGLAQKWEGVCWMNPPYGRTIGDWMKKAKESAEEGATVVCLVPARTDTRWWHDYAVKAKEIRYLKGRLKFGKAENSAPFPSAVIIFMPPDRTPS
ncbi:DNA N-6-adenine-methyltransferase [Armatimonas sp.]|uniref:DNA N-6-adenine-methyltransferase n=1 Tax=Armatimonas sp. TaxID=1872638 RepID=UPI00286AA5DE|nr:DNA N-6-adenine-methyltransferase [Armatimonas sp.]